MPLHILKEHEQIILSSKDREIFVQALLNPPKLSKNLITAAKRYRKKIISKGFVA